MLENGFESSSRWGSRLRGWLNIIGPAYCFLHKSTISKIICILRTAPSQLVVPPACAGDERNRTLVILGQVMEVVRRHGALKHPFAFVKMTFISLSAPYILSLHINTVYPVQGTYRQNQRKTTTILGTRVVLSPSPPQCIEVGWMQNDRGNNRLRRESRQVGLCWDVTAALVKYTHCYMHGPDY